MTLRVRSLFLKIFLWFWATVIATAIALVLTWIFLQPRDIPSQLQISFADAAWASGTAAVNAIEQQGAQVASAYIERVNQHSHFKSCLFNDSGAPLAGTECSNLKVSPHTAVANRPEFSVYRGYLRVAVPLSGKSGRRYIYAAQTNERHWPPESPRLRNIALRAIVAFLVSGLICYLLARYLTAPILRLRKASQRLAAGDLSTRASAGMEHRRDEIGSLVRDFNTMAARIEDLVSRQRQLIYDISHELRSPLARLNVALDLSRQRKGDDPAFDHMERDIECLNEMIGRLLTVARLDASATPVPMSRVDLTDIVWRIAGSAEFELRNRNGIVHFSSTGEYVIQGNAELLHSAIENVVRNAVRHTGPGESVDVRLESADTPGMIRILVRDTGPGVPEPELDKIFQPFYRVDNDRNRESGGSGLGLAIADRVVCAHGGSITARNATPHGLEVEIRLPLDHE